MRVLFDTQIFDWQINGGISRYFIEVLQRLEQDKQVEVLFKCKHSYNTYIQNTAWLSNRSVLKNLHFKGKLSAIKIINQKLNRIYSNRLLQKGDIDIFHPTYYDPYFLRHLKKKPMVLTVYDLTDEKYNDYTALTKKVLAWKKELINAANHIIAISENTKNDIIEYYNISPEKITTIYLSGGFDLGVQEASIANEENNLPEKFILFVGSRSRYKNFINFVHEVAPVISDENICLVAAGGGKMNTEELKLFKELNIEDRVVTLPQASDVLLAQSYKKSLIFIFPSLYEGFGLPVLEAMQCGCPCLLSNNSSLPEIGGNAAAYFDPLVRGSLQKKLQALLNNDNERSKMKVAGIEQLKQFNWDITAQKHIQVYQNVLQQ